METIKKNKLETKNMIIEMRTTLEAINSRLDEAEDRIGDLEGKVAENTQLEHQKERESKRKKIFYGTSETTSSITIFTSQGYQKRKEKEKGIDDTFEKIITKNFPNLAKELNIQVQGTWRVLNMMNPKKVTPRHIIIKILRVKDKERILKAARE